MSHCSVYKIPIIFSVENLGFEHISLNSCCQMHSVVIFCKTKNCNVYMCLCLLIPEKPKHKNKFLIENSGQWQTNLMLNTCKWSNFNQCAKREFSGITTHTRSHYTMISFVSFAHTQWNMVFFCRIRLFVCSFVCECIVRICSFSFSYRANVCASFSSIFLFYLF